MVFETVKFADGSEDWVCTVHNKSELPRIGRVIRAGRDMPSDYRVIAHRGEAVDRYGNTVYAYDVDLLPPNIYRHRDEYKE